jgi:AcrR family transcriptional regulator
MGVPMEHAPEPRSDAGLAAEEHIVSQRGSLTRRKVLATAVAVMDAEGLSTFSMRRVAAALGVEAMALYHYVRGREDLLDGVVDLVIEEFNPPLLSGRSADWRGYLRLSAYGMRHIAHAHPLLFPLVATRPPAAPWVRPPLRSVKWMESFLATLDRSGFSDSASVATYRAFSSFLLGHLLLEVANDGAQGSPVREPDRGDPPEGSLAQYPRLERLQRELSQDQSAVEFEQALNNLIRRLSRLRTR